MYIHPSIVNPAIDTPIPYLTIQYHSLFTPFSKQNRREGLNKVNGNCAPEGLVVVVSSSSLKAHIFPDILYYLSSVVVGNTFTKCG
jgi:hypothetical protein